MAVFYDSTRNLVGHQNVRLPKDAPSNMQTNPMLYETLKPLIDSKPSWRIAINNFINYHSGGKVISIANSVRIYEVENDELLGDVSVDEHGRNRTEKVAVSNSRITDNKARGGPYRTSSIAKAQLAIRKHFYPLDSAALVKGAFSHTFAVASAQETALETKARRAKHAFLQQADDFVFKFVDLYIENMPGAKKLHEEMEEHVGVYEVLKNLKEDLDNDKPCRLVIVKERVYIVATRTESGDTFHLAEFAELPYELKGKVGMLQMVEPTQAISNVGMRVADDVFFLPGLK